ncbi:carbohydrate-binding protein [Colletotrichum tofieldiae]|uniref:Carbohydrate-binding protein n=1 Tax=Colletotrichum tofieldiae TaxID=708197 RepID=A0A166RN27_9PEZI|nr:carbohydrate-binding protein [Colletotrichum tofieldiae]GKT89627.1 carbohydrate-binding protein [Colletotrichum tofieldiae]
MHTITVLAAFVASGAAQLMTSFDLAQIPAPNLQTVPIGVGNQTVSATNSRRALKKLVARDCNSLPVGSGPVPSVDTDQAFLAFSDLSSAALNAKTPSGWYQTFQNLQSATSASVYQGYKTYSSYDPARCAADCAQISGCSSFNIFFERDPTLAPGLACPDPSSTTVIKCSFWGVGIGPSTATNNGQYSNDFHVVIAGSNGYQLSAPTYDVSGYNSSFTNAATINAPSSCNSYITYKAHTNQAYDPALCAADCAAQRLETNPFNGLRCRFFTSYSLVKNGVVQAQICALYSRTWDQSYATNTGYSSGSDVYTIQYAYSYTFAADIGNFNCPQGGSTANPTTSSSTSTSATLITISTTSLIGTTTTTPITTSTSLISTTTTTTGKPTTLSTSSVKPTTSSTSGASQSPLTSCPSPVSYVVGSQGGLYAVCLDTDFQIPSPQIYYGYQSNQDCVSTCEATAGCTKAVFKPSTQTCYLKGSPSVSASNWAVNQGFQTLVKVPDGTALTKCLVPTYSVKSGSTVYQVCPSSDFTNNPATDIWYGVSSDAACISLCQSRQGCTKIVYNFVTKTCYNKGNPSLASTGWHVNTQFRAIYIS